MVARALALVAALLIAAPAGASVTKYGGGGGGGGSSAFSAITSGTNTTATMTCGTGCSVVPSGTGDIQATQLTDGANFGAALVPDAGHEGFQWDVLAGPNTSGALQDSGTATGGSTSTLIDTGQAWADDEHNGRLLVLRPGTGTEEFYTITDTVNATQTLTVNGQWESNPVGGVDSYEIRTVASDTTQIKLSAGSLYADREEYNNVFCLSYNSDDCGTTTKTVSTEHLWRAQWEMTYKPDAGVDMKTEENHNYVSSDGLVAFRPYYFEIRDPAGIAQWLWTARDGYNNFSVLENTVQAMELRVLGRADDDPSYSGESVTGIIVTTSSATGASTGNLTGLLIDMDMEPNSGAIPEYIGISIPSPEGEPSGTTISNQYAIRIRNQLGLGGTNNALVRFDAQTCGAGCSLAQASGNVVWFGGNWNDGHLAFLSGGDAGDHVWMDQTNEVLRLAVDDAPDSETDGRPIVTGSNNANWGPMFWGVSNASGAATFDTGTEVCAAHALTCVDSDVMGGDGSATTCATTHADGVNFWAFCQ